MRSALIRPLKSVKMGDELFTQDTVREFMASKGGKVKNHELVTHFRRFLNDPQGKVANRGKFREFVNTLATVKLDESGEKVLVLKRKFRNSFRDPSTSSRKKDDSDFQYERPKKRPPKAFPTPVENESSTDPEGAVGEEVSSEPREGSQSPIPEETPEDDGKIEIVAAREEDEEVQDDGDQEMQIPVLNLHSHIGESSTDDFVDDSTVTEPPEAMNTSEDDVPQSPPQSVEDTSEITSPEADTSILEESTDDTDAVKLPAPEWEQQPPEPAPVKLPAPVWDKPAPPPTTPATTGPTPSKEPPMSVKERAKHLNRMQSESELLQPKKRDKSRGTGNEDDTNSVSSVGTIALDAAGREWMITCSTGDYQAINKLLTKNHELAKRKDFITNALHWAAKHGNGDVIKLLCGTGLVDINARSGYTALHLACMHGHDQIIELLVQGYFADPTIRDYSGKKPHQYLPNAASSKTKQILQPRRLTSSHMTQPFRRQGSYSSKIQKSDYFGITSSSAIRNSWASNASDNEAPSRSPSPSPRIQRKTSMPSIVDIRMMPPPQQVPPRRRKKNSIKKQPDEASSDSELPKRSDSLPNISNSMPDVSGTRAISTLI